MQRAISHPSTMITPEFRALTNNSTEGGFVQRIPTTTRPASVDESGDPTANAAVFAAADNAVVVTPFGKDANNDAFDIRVYGWSRSSGDLWYPTMLIEFTCTLTNVLPGVAGANVVADEIFADEVVPDVTNTGTDNYELISPKSDIGVAKVIVDHFGSELIELQFDLDSASAANALYRFV